MKGWKKAKKSWQKRPQAAELDDLKEQHVWKTSGLTTEP